MSGHESESSVLTGEAWAVVRGVDADELWMLVADPGYGYIYGSPLRIDRFQRGHVVTGTGPGAGEQHVSEHLQRDGSTRRSTAVVLERLGPRHVRVGQLVEPPDEVTRWSTIEVAESEPGTARLRIARSARLTEPLGRLGRRRLAKELQNHASASVEIVEANVLAGLWRTRGPLR